MNYKIEAESH